MKTMNISMAFSVNNGEWDGSKKIERDGKFSHSIDLGLFNDHSTFECVLATLKREFEFTLENALNTVMQRMLDNRPDAAELKEEEKAE
jgi:hypothetical protein